LGIFETSGGNARADWETSDRVMKVVADSNVFFMRNTPEFCFVQVPFLRGRRDKLFMEALNKYKVVIPAKAGIQVFQSVTGCRFSPA
jgi:hypothetical protein